MTAETYLRIAGLCLLLPAAVVALDGFDFEVAAAVVLLLAPPSIAVGIALIAIRRDRPHVVRRAAIAVGLWALILMPVFFLGAFFAPSAALAWAGAQRAKVAVI